ncbi:MAG: ABC transporter permease subunit [Nitriliruptorales bacterium]|nr:ABC transporter permease subunit [Nitriliruptorales bacterium]
MAAEALGQRRAVRPPPWRDIRVLRVVIQVAFLVVVVATVWYLYNNLRSNTRLGFDWLQQPAGFSIRDAPGYSPGQRVLAAIRVGFFNTAQVAFLGIALATVLGIIIGIARLSTNWLVRRAAALYVEALRNIPVLLIIVLIYGAVMLQLPGVANAGEFLESFIFSNRGVSVPWYQSQEGATSYVAVIGLGVLVAAALWVWRTRRFDRTGEPHHRVLWALGTVAGFILAGYFVLGAPIALSLPELEGRRVTGGTSLGTEYAALLIGLVLYTASHIAEIVRGSIQAVPHGQTEAANAIALTGFQRLRYVVLPQAFRIMIPPLANQYLNLTKNSSLAVAIGYPELTRIIGTVIGNGNPAPPSIAILMGCYLIFSIGISIITNIVNRALSLEPRT